MKNRYSPPNLFILVAVIICTLAIIVLVPSLANAAPIPLPPRPIVQPTAELPDRPTPDATAEPVPASLSTGSLIRLQLQLPSETLSRVDSWQMLWTVVQWQDPEGSWHDVEGWQGTFDDFTDDTKQRVAEGQKLWWVAPGDLGTGPFRWLIKQSHDGEHLAISAPFQLPDTDGTLLPVEVSIGP
jgi:hypothetical protein